MESWHWVAEPLRFGMLSIDVLAGASAVGCAYAGAHSCTYQLEHSWNSPPEVLHVGCSPPDEAEFQQVFSEKVKCLWNGETSALGLCLGSQLLLCPRAPWPSLSAWGLALLLLIAFIAELNLFSCDKFGLFFPTSQITFWDLFIFNITSTSRIEADSELLHPGWHWQPLISFCGSG